jgi:hypothetical protein
VPMTADSVFEAVSFQAIQFPQPARRTGKRMKFTATDLKAASILSQSVDPIQAKMMEDMVTMKDNEDEDDDDDSELLNFERAHVFVDYSQVARVFSQSFGHLGPDSTAKLWCDGLNFLVSLYPDASISDKGFVYNLLEDLANRMRSIFPKWINGTNALQHKLLVKLSEYDGPLASMPVGHSAASCGASVGTNTSSRVSGVCACDNHTYNIPPEASAASCSSHVSHMNLRH